MYIKLITAAAEAPVSIEEFKSHLRMGAEPSSEDGDLALKLAAATGNIEAEVGYPLIHSVWDVYSECWPSELPHNQVSTVASIKYTPAGTSQMTVDASTYNVVGLYDESAPTQYAGECCIVLGYLKLWPTVALETGLPVVTRITSGWKDAASVPEPLKIAVLLEAAHLYRDRESVTIGNTAIESKALMRGVDHFIAPYRRWKF